MSTSPTTSILSAVTSPLRNTSTPQLRSKDRFERYAQRQADGELGLSESAFVDAITPEGEDYHKIKREQYAILFLVADRRRRGDRKSTRLNSSHITISYAVFCLK